jgi:hypothetical protein
VTERKLLNPPPAAGAEQKKTPLPAVNEVADRNTNGSDRGTGKKKQRGRK